MPGHNEIVNYTISAYLACGQVLVYIHVSLESKMNIIQFRNVVESIYVVVAVRQQRCCRLENEYVSSSYAEESRSYYRQRGHQLEMSTSNNRERRRIIHLWESRGHFLVLSGNIRTWY